MSEPRWPSNHPRVHSGRRGIHVGFGATAAVLAVVGAMFATGACSKPESDDGRQGGNPMIARTPDASDGTGVTSGAATHPPTGTPTRTPAARPAAESRCPLPKYPTPACTGVPRGTVFARTVQGDYDATVAGQVIDKLHITGNLNIKAPGVVITNSQIDRSVFNRFGPGGSTYSYTITDSTIGPATGCIRAAALQEANYTATRVHIRGVDHGVDMSEPGHVLVQDSYLVMCWLPASVAPPDGSHVDGIQTYCGAACTDLRLSHNTFDMRPDGKGTFVINIKDTHVAAVTVTDNLLAGGDNYVIVAQWRTGPDLVVENNRVVNNTWGNTAPASAEGTCDHQRWRGNTVVDIDADYNVTRVVRELPCID